jgi:hypothetical protein
MDSNTPNLPTTSLTIRLQQLEKHMMQTIPPTDKCHALLKFTFMFIRVSVTKFFANQQDFCPLHWSDMQKTFFYLKSYIYAHPEIHWDESHYSDILYIYRYSKPENDTKEKVIACLNALEEKISYHHKQYHN